VSIETINPSRMKIRDLLNYKIHAPREFQRRVVWNQTVKVKYIQSHNRGNSISTITLVDVAACIEYNKKNNNDIERFQYYYDLGHRYLAIDGQNRIICLRSFYDDKLQIHGRFFNHDGEIVQIGSSLLSTIKTKHSRLYDYFRDLEVIVVILSKRTWDDLHTLFRDINSGLPLNAMEKRNSLATSIGPILLSIAEASYFNNVWSKVSGYKHSKLSRMLDVETVVKAFMITHNITSPQTGDYILRNKQLSESALDKLYEVGVSKRSNQIREYNTESIERFKNISEMWSCAIDSSTNAANGCPQKLMWSMLYTIEYLYDSGYVSQIDDLNWGIFFQMIRDIVSNLETTSQKEYTKALQDFEDKNHSLRRALVSASDDDIKIINQKIDDLKEPSKASYFFYKVSNVLNPTNRNDTRSGITNQMIDIMSEYDLFYSAEIEEEDELLEA
jgi:hypothetical protein